ncbi:hypothetical protein SDC9_72730 [bioreactor metagenome]|uniref:Uncharacterized protein n=1 Tax=bioreactor metagenome TaxID=1076179 RepID=A0A644YD63_9ZZZZ
MNGFNKAVIHGNRHVAREQRALAGAVESADVGIVAVHLYAARVHGRPSIDIFLKLAEILFKGLAADVCGAAFTENGKVAVGQLLLSSMFVLDLRELHINAFKHGKAVIGGLCHITQLCQQLFAFFVQGVGSCTVNVLNHMAITLERIACKVLLQLLLRNGQNFRVNKSDGGIERHEKVHGLCGHFLILAVAVVPAFLERSIGIDKLHLLQS